MEDKGKTIAIVSYITLIGWVIAFIMYNSEEKKSSLARFHIKQALGLIFFSIAIWLAITILTVMLAFVSLKLVLAIGFIMNLVWIGILVLLILGIVNAANANEKPLPIIGKFADEKLTFIK